MTKKSRLIRAQTQLVSKKLLAILRITLGFIFLWAYLDKLFGLGFSTGADNSWLAGVSPTYGFLKFTTRGPLAAFYQSLAGNVLVDWLFMLGLFGIGTALILGIGITIAVYSGSLLLLLMWSARLPPEHNPLLDEHIIYILTLWILYKSGAENYFGFGKWWAKTKLVKKFPFLK